jgi:uncharacterized protein YodC (DUF2158 family)
VRQALNVFQRSERMAETFKVGEVVQLNSGGPRMTVSSIGSEGTVNCTWFNQTDHAFELKWAKFAAATLQRAT